MTLPQLALTPPVGPDGAPLVVLGSSLGTAALLWEDVIPALAQHHRVIAWDLPGHGRSPRATEPFTVEELADAVAASVDGPFAYAGVSLGGAVGLALALRHPDRVTAAAIVASGARLGDAAAWNERAATVRAQSTSVLITASAGRWFAPGSVERRPEITGRLLHALQDADDESYARCCEALAQWDVRAQLPRIGVPVLAVWGEHDPVAPEPLAREIADAVPGGRAVRIADAGHLPPAEQPEAVAAVLLDFFGASR